MQSESRVADLRSLTNDQVTQRVEQLSQKQRRVCADLLLYLSELDCRKLYRSHACSSVFDFLTARLGQSEDVAYRWMWGARLMRAFPLVYELLVEGKLHLSALVLLKPHLTAENHCEWLMAAAGRSKRDVEKLVAARCPKGEVPSRVRRLPECSSAVTRSELPRMDQPSPAADTQSSQKAARPPGLDTPSRSPKIQPLSAHSYRVVFTASEQLREKLDRAGELVSHAIPPADLPALIERALDLLIEREERRRYGSARRAKTSATVSAAVTKHTDVGSTSTARRNEVVPATKSGVSSPQGLPAKPLENQPVAKPAAGMPQDSSARLVPPSRYIPAAVRRQVWERDSGQCTYVDQEGRRCQSRHRLEFDHCIAYALGGPPTVGNVRLRCKSHNTLAAEQVFGDQRIAVAIAVTRERRTAITAAKRQRGSAEPP